MTGAVAEVTAGAAGGCAPPGHSPRAAKPAAAASATPVTATASGRLPRASGGSGTVCGGSVRGASVCARPTPGAELGDGVDIDVPAARQVPLAGRPCGLV